MVARSRLAFAQVFALTLFAFIPTLAGASVFENSVLRDFQVSGPVALAPGQNASVCVTNLDDSPVGILIGLLQADTGSLLAVREAALQPGEGACLNFAQQAPGPNQPPGPGGNVIGLVLPNAHVNGQGAIVQDRPGGGCITASLQIQSVANDVVVSSQYVPMQEHHEHHRLRRAE